MYEKRGEEDIGRLVEQESSQYDILFVTRPAYTMLGNRISSTYSRTAAKDLVEGSELLSKNTYLAVITDDSAIARKAAQKRIPFILLQDNPSQTHELLAERNPYSYCIDPTQRGFIFEFVSSVDEILSSYKQPKPTILLVDNDPFYLRLCTQTLENQYNIKTADNINEAASIIKEKGIDVIITDLELDYVMSGGFHILQEVIAEKLDIPVILHSGRGKSPAVRSYAKEAGIYEILTKTSDSVQLLPGLIEKALKGRKQKGLSTTPFTDGTEDKAVAELSDAEESTKRFMEIFATSKRELKSSLDQLL